MMQATTKPEGAAEIVKLLTELQHYVDEHGPVDWVLRLPLDVALRLEEAGVGKVLIEAGTYATR